MIIDLSHRIDGVWKANDLELSKCFLILKFIRRY